MNAMSEAGTHGLQINELISQLAREGEDRNYKVSLMGE